MTDAVRMSDSEFVDGIFISYRTGDGEYAAKLLDAALVARFGRRHVFFASRSIEGAELFEQRLLQALERCTVLVPIIGDKWLTTGRIDDPDDWVHREIRSSLERSKAILPVYLGRTPRLREQDLPEGIRNLTKSQYESFSTRDIDLVTPKLVRRLGELMPRPASPYRGLAAFGEDDRDVFAGRATEIWRLLDRLGRQQVVAVEGGSGSGKSSLVRAGLAPALRDEGITVVVFEAQAVEGMDAVAQLAARFDELIGAGATAELIHDVPLLESTLVGECGRLVLCVDQFEQLVLARPDEARRLFDLVTELVRGQRIRAVFTVRSSADLQQLGDNATSVIESGGFLVQPMKPEDLAAAITEPAVLRGREFEANLVERIVADAGDQAGQLPLVEFVLTALWDAEPPGLLTLAGYERLGGVAGALRQRAQQTYKELTNPAQAKDFRDLFTQLASPREDDPKSYLLSSMLLDQATPATMALVERLSAQRLVVIRTGPNATKQVSIAHEALIHQWDQLTQWLDEVRDFRLWQERLRGNMRQWRDGDKDAGGLLRGAALTRAVEHLEAHADQMTGAEREYVQASRKEARRSVRWRRGLFMMLCLSVVVVLVVGITGYIAMKTSDRLRVLAYSRNAVSQVGPLRAPDAALAAQLSQAAYAVAPTEESIDMVLSMASTANPLARKLTVSTGIESVALDDAGTVLAGARADGSVELWSVSDRREPHELGTYPAHQGVVRSVSFAGDATMMATGGDDGRVILWDTSSPQAIVARYRLPSISGKVLSAELNHDGTLLAVSGTDHTVTVWSVGLRVEPSLLHTIKAGDDVRAVFNHDSTMLATASMDHIVTLWSISDTHQFAQLSTFTPGRTGVTAIAFSRSGRTLATGGIHLQDQPNDSQLYDISYPRRPEHRGDLATGGLQASAFVFGPDDRHLATSNTEGALRWFDLTDMAHPLGQTNQVQSGLPVTGLAMNASGSVLAVGDSGYAVRLWDPTIFAPALPGGVLSEKLNHRGDILATSGQDGATRLWDARDARNLKLLSVLPGYAKGTGGLAFSPDDAELIAVGLDESIRFWNIARPTAPSKIGDAVPGPPTTSKALVDHDASAVMTTQKDTVLVAGAVNGKLTLRSVDGKHRLSNPILLDTADDSALGLAFAHNPAGIDLLAVAGPDDIVKLWDVSHPDAPVLAKNLFSDYSVFRTAAFSPDGRTLAIGGSGKQVWLWDVSDPRAPNQIGSLPIVFDVYSLAFNDQTHGQLAVGTKDGYLQVWNVGDRRDMKKYVNLDRHWGPVRALEFGHGGDTLFSGGDDHSVHLWELDPVAAGKYICGRYTPVLTKDNWHKYFPNVDYTPFCPPSA